MASPKKSKKSKKDRKLKKNLSLVPVEPKAADSDWWDSFFNPSASSYQSLLTKLQWLVGEDLINRSSRNATVLKLTKCRTVEALEFGANVCPGLVTLSLPGDVLDNKHTNLELIWQVEKFGDLSKGSVQGREASSIVMLVPYQVLKFEGDCFGFDENDNEISKLASHISKFMRSGSEFPEFLRGLDNLVLPVDGYSFDQHVEENWDEMLNDLLNAFNDLRLKEQSMSLSQHPYKT
ncbi:unnamed protein product [Prunus armeniaca]